MEPNAIGAQFTGAAAAYAAAIQPYALKLFLGLLFIEVLVAAIQYMIDQGEAPHISAAHSDTCSVPDSSTSCW